MKYRQLKEWPGSPDKGTIWEWSFESLDYSSSLERVKHLQKENVENSPEWFEKVEDEDERKSSNDDLPRIPNKLTYHEVETGLEMDIVIVLNQVITYLEKLKERE